MRLYRPIGYQELELIADSNFFAFPPRLPSQPIFYPVLNLEYGIQIAKDWNTTDPNSGFAGFVTQFDVNDAYISQFEIQIVGSSQVHQELWIPAENLSQFNKHILGDIKIVAAYYGSNFPHPIDPVSNLPATIKFV
ncbi:ADP-ribosylation/crystallin J1 [Chamaesiphon sp. GL140_3_metabinner_50]|uniref:ADP-ribosylation/crystallin J1 n=1 Tax=Chamaesiphon sp. GL140_3_metabinner_50 TaxID=2970812 RepID=UPI0025F7072E|nr:ADP-ribosylation/crystallin J1 [Chamaesiphon sp. GL140_3_metabinner_50]